MYEVDDSTWPIVAVSWTGTVTDAEVTAFLARLDGWLARGQRFGLLIDTLNLAGTVSARQREQIVQHMKASKERTGRLLVQAIVHDHPLHRALYQAVSFVFPLPFPSKTFPEPESARLWLKDKLHSVKPG
jgi:hypothetical protein